MKKSFVARRHGIIQSLAQVWEVLKPKIEESSTTFFELIKHLKAEDLNKLDDKTRFTIWKYYNKKRSKIQSLLQKMV